MIAQVEHMVRLRDFELLHVAASARKAFIAHQEVLVQGNTHALSVSFGCYNYKCRTNIKLVPNRSLWRRGRIKYPCMQWAMSTCFRLSFRVSFSLLINSIYVLIICVMNLIIDLQLLLPK